MVNKAKGTPARKVFFSLPEPAARDGKEQPEAKGTPAKISAAPAGFTWSNNELKTFWESCYPSGYNYFILDGLHPQTIYSKLCNNVLRTNFNKFAGFTVPPQDRLLCFEVIAQMERRLIAKGIVEQPIYVVTK